MEKEITTALIAAATSIATILIFKPFVDKNLLRFRLKENHIADQSKKVKEHIASHKGRLLKSAEHLNNRLKNFAKNHGESWLIRSGNYTTNSHYFDTFVYRFLSFFAHIKLIEKDIVYLDATISQESDVRMLKYFRVFHDVMCDVDLFEGLVYNKNNQTDHFFTTPFYNLSNHFINNKQVIELDDFLSKKIQILPHITPVCQFFDSISPAENRLRCERLKAFHIVLMAFLNEYGYDFQYTSRQKCEFLKNQLGNYRLVDNLRTMIKKYKLNRFCGPIERVLYSVN